MAGITGGIQSYKGSLFGIPYEVGSWQDYLIEAFAGTHDHMGGKISGLYDEQGNAARDRAEMVTTAHSAWSGVALVPFIPFAMVTLIARRSLARDINFIRSSKMKQRIWIGMALGLSFLLSGCNKPIYVAGWGDYLKSIKPHLEYWEKPGMTEEERRLDSVGCGAGYVDFYSSRVLKAVQREGETIRQTEDRLHMEWYQCMEAKGYRDVRKVATPKD